MNSIDIDNLLEVSKLRKEIKNKFTNKKLNDQGLEQDLTKVYKPLTESQNKNAAALITHLSDLANTNNRQIIDFKDTFRNFPDLLRSIDEIKSLLDIKTTEIINKIKSHDPAAVKDIEELNDEQEHFGDALDEMMSVDTGIGTMATDESLGAISKITKRDTTQKTKEYVEKEAEVREKMKRDEDRINSTVNFMANEASKRDNRVFKEALYEREIQGDLIKYVELNPDTNLSYNPWKKIGSVNPALYNELKQIKKGKTGKGLSCGCKPIKFLPDNKKNLSHELIRLMGSYRSGNKAVFNELNAVVDELRRKGILTLEQSKKIYQTIKQ